MAPSRRKPTDIDSYLRERGSPMAGQGATFMRAGKKYGVDPRLLVGIATIESGAGAHEKLRFNPFNWGVHRGQSYGSYEESIMDVARGLRRNYLDQGLTDPHSIVSKYAPSSDGNNESNWANVVSQVMGQLGGRMPPSRGGGAQPAAPPAPTPYVSTRPQFSQEAFKQNFLNALLSGHPPKGREISDMIFASYQTPPPVPPQVAPGVPTAGAQAPGAAPPLPSGEGGFMQLPTKWKSTHPTSGLSDQGFTHAVDIMGSPGTSVGAPVSGTIVRHGSAQGGQSLWFKGDDGRTYWIGHIESDIPAGTQVKKGQVIARISADHPRPHVHLDYAG